MFLHVLAHLLLYITILLQIFEMFECFSDLPSSYWSTFNSVWYLNQYADFKFAQDKYITHHGEHHVIFYFC